MEIIIKEGNDGFLFFEGEELIYVGLLRTKKLRLFKQLYDNNEQLITETKLSFRLPFNFFYRMRFLDKETTIDLKYASILKPRLVCTFENDLYEIIPHKGLKTSVFKNNKQIAFFEEQSLELFENKTIRLVADRNMNRPLIFSTILTLKCNYEEDPDTFNFNLGNVGPEYRKFDPNWEPD